MKFVPSFRLFSQRVFTALIAVVCVAYLWQRYSEGHLWSVDDVYSLAIPVALFPIFIWLVFVPKALEISENRFTVEYRFRTVREIEWTELRYWGYAGFGVFCLQFNSIPTFQIALFAFAPSQRGLFIDFLSRRFPQCKARAWVGTKGIRW